MIVGWIAIIFIVVLGLVALAMIIIALWACIKAIGTLLSGARVDPDDRTAENGSFYNENGDWIG